MRLKLSGGHQVIGEIVLQYVIEKLKYKKILLVKLLRTTECSPIHQVELDS